MWDCLKCETGGMTSYSSAIARAQRQTEQELIDKMVSGQNGLNQNGLYRNGPLPKRPLPKTASNRNGLYPKRPLTETASSRNGL